MSSFNFPTNDLPVPSGSAAPGCLDPHSCNHHPDRIKILLEQPDCVLHCFGRSDVKLNKAINRLSYALNDTQNVLTVALESNLTEWNRRSDDAKATRRRVNLTGMDLNSIDAILEGAITLKRYTLFLSTQICELMPKPE